MLLEIFMKEIQRERFTKTNDSPITMFLYKQRKSEISWVSQQEDKYRRENAAW